MAIDLASCPASDLNSDKLHMTIFLQNSQTFTCENWEVMASSNITYERTPDLAEHNDNSLTGQLWPVTGQSCFRASSDRVD